MNSAVVTLNPKQLIKLLQWKDHIQYVASKFNKAYFNMLCLVQ